MGGRPYLLSARFAVCMLSKCIFSISVFSLSRCWVWAPKAKRVWPWPLPRQVNKIEIILCSRKKPAKIMKKSSNLVKTVCTPYTHTEITQSGPWKKREQNLVNTQAGGVSISRPPATCPAIRCVLVGQNDSNRLCFNIDFAFALFARLCLISARSEHFLLSCCRLSCCRWH